MTTEPAALQHILIADDDPAIRQVLKRLLTREGFQVTAVEDGTLALTSLADRPADLNFLDVEMPGMDGITVLKQIKARHPRTEVVMITGYADIEMFREAILENGAADYILKPFHPKEILNTAAYVLSRRKMKESGGLSDAHHLSRRLEQMGLEYEERLRDLRQSQIHFREILENSNDMIVVIQDNRLAYFNPLMAATTGYETDALKELDISEIIYGDDRDLIQERIYKRLTGQPLTDIQEFRLRRRTGDPVWVEANSKRTIWDGRPAVLSFMRDITQRRMMESQLVQEQKLESIGQLAAGIAHEINTPTRYVGDNIQFLKDTFDDLFPLLALYRNLRDTLPADGPHADLMRRIIEMEAEAEIDYLREEVPVAIAQSMEGVGRISSIVRSMATFSHPGGTEKCAVDINKAIESTVTVSRNEWKYVAELAVDLAPDLPPVPCLPGELNQVILNLIINAAHAIGDVVGDGATGKGKIFIQTALEDDTVLISIRDSGTGIPKAVRNRIFDPFFTTKDVGKGTGQGLAIAHSVIVEKHGGSLTFQTKESAGTTFFIRLPLN